MGIRKQQTGGTSHTTFPILAVAADSRLYVIPNNFQPNTKSFTKFDLSNWPTRRNDGKLINTAASMPSYND